MPGKVHSKAQQRFFGAVASGSLKKSGLSKGKAEEILHADKGKMSKLPEKVKKGKKK